MKKVNLFKLAKKKERLNKKLTKIKVKIEEVNKVALSQISAFFYWGYCSGGAMKKVNLFKLAKKKERLNKKLTKIKVKIEEVNYVLGL